MKASTGVYVREKNPTRSSFNRKTALRVSEEHFLNLMTSPRNRHRRPCISQLHSIKRQFVDNLSKQTHKNCFCLEEKWSLFQDKHCFQLPAGKYTLVQIIDYCQVFTSFNKYFFYRAPFRVKEVTFVRSSVRIIHSQKCSGAYRLWGREGGGTGLAQVSV